MYVDDQTYKRGNKVYRRVLLRHSQRVGGGKKKNFVIANISNCNDNEIEAIKLALQYKHKLSYLTNLAEGGSENWKLPGVVISLFQLSQRLGISQAVGTQTHALLVLWLIFARIIEQGSRLSAVRLADIHAGCEILGIDRLTEDDLYAALDWLYEQKGSIEQRLFHRWQKDKQASAHNHIFLYDLSSSYFEGDLNELGEYGYNRDGKKGKKIVTYGLLTDDQGDPLGIEVFPGNTADNHTVADQITKLKHKYNAHHITLVGDKGMIKEDQIKALGSEDFHFITSITKAQINSLVKQEVFQMDLFDDQVCEVEDDRNNLRYILRQNPLRRKEIQENRESKISTIQQKVEKANTYLKEHPRAKVATQLNQLTSYIKKLKLSKALSVYQAQDDSRIIELHRDEDALKEMGKLDGCYVIKTDLPKEIIDKQTVHDRYKDLAFVEKAFRVHKSELEIRPVYLRKKERTIAHIFISMLAYKIERYMRKCWRDEDMTVKAALETLKQISSVKIKQENTTQVFIPKPNKICSRLLKKINVIMPEMIPYKEVDVHTNKKLQERRN
jgi:transposase